jgi:hypothetical protein
MQLFNLPEFRFTANNPDGIGVAYFRRPRLRLRPSVSSGTRETLRRPAWEANVASARWFE